MRIWCFIPFKTFTLGSASYRRRSVGISVAVNCVITGAARNRIVAGVAFKRVIAWATVNAVVTTFAEDRIVAAAACQDVVAAFKHDTAWGVKVHVRNVDAGV